MAEPSTGFAEAIGALRGAGVTCVVVGAYGINLYATAPSQILLTEDCDLPLPADPTVLGAAFEVLRAVGFALSLGGEPFLGAGLEDLRTLVRHRSTVRAVRGRTQLDLMLAVAGLEHADAWARGREFVVRGQSIRAAPLADLLESKRLVGRPKDRAFLESWKFAVESARDDEARRIARELGERDSGDAR
ncbi:MAG TPA: hypothetical protein VJP77_06565 [Planctomycetota bacterium]|nr:hypothetical protein [Planctomycetota bacterium]